MLGELMNVGKQGNYFNEVLFYDAPTRFEENPGETVHTGGFVRQECFDGLMHLLL
jgi:hypothetical protein